MPADKPNLGDGPGAGFVPVALVWSEGQGDRHVWGGHGTALSASPATLDARRETTVTSAMPRSVSSGAAANKPLFLRGSDLPVDPVGLAGKLLRTSTRPTSHRFLLLHASV